MSTVEFRAPCPVCGSESTWASTMVGQYGTGSITEPRDCQTCRAAK